MSSIPDTVAGVPFERSRGLSPVQFAALATLLSILGVSTIWFTAVSLWTLWTTDALKSIGMVIPPVSLILILRAWRKLGWEAQGTWWGLALLVTVAVVSKIQQKTILMLVISPHVVHVTASSVAGGSGLRFGRGITDGRDSTLPDGLVPDPASVVL